MQYDLTRRRLMALLAAAAPLFPLRAQAQTTGAPDVEQINDFGNWRVVSIANDSRAFVIPERLASNYAQTADKSDFGSAELTLEYWSVNGGAYSATLKIDSKYDPLAPDRHHTVNVYVDDVEAGSFEAIAGAKQDALALLGAMDKLTAAHNLRVEMEIGDETLTILDLDMTGIADAVPAMKVIPDYNYNVLGYGRTDPDASSASCFITAACCGLLGLPDDCWELRALRRFRDEVMLSTPDGRTDVARYYQRAPAILKAMRRAREERRLLGVYVRYVLPSALAAQLGLRSTARRLYSAMMAELTRRYLSAGA